MSAGQSDRVREARVEAAERAIRKHVTLVSGCKVDCSPRDTTAHHAAEVALAAADAVSPSLADQVLALANEADRALAERFEHPEHPGLVQTNHLRALVADSDAPTTEQERAEGAVQALRDAADAQERLATGPRALGSKSVEFRRRLFAGWLRDRADGIARTAPTQDGAR